MGNQDYLKRAMQTKMRGFLTEENMKELERYIGSCSAVFYGIVPRGETYSCSARGYIGTELPWLNVMALPLHVHSGDGDPQANGKNITLIGHMHEHYKDKKVAVFSDLPAEETTRPFIITRAMSEGPKDFVYVMCAPNFEMLDRDHIYRSQLIAECKEREGVMEVRDFGDEPLEWLKRKKRSLKNYFKKQDVAFILDLQSDASPFAMAYSLYLTDLGKSVVYVPLKDSNDLEGIRDMHGQDMKNHRIMTFGDRKIADEMRTNVEDMGAEIGIKGLCIISTEKIRRDLSD